MFTSTRKNADAHLYKSRWRSLFSLSCHSSDSHPFLGDLVGRIVAPPMDRPTGRPILLASTHPSGTYSTPTYVEATASQCPWIIYSGTYLISVCLPVGISVADELSINWATISMMVRNVLEPFGNTNIGVCWRPAVLSWILVVVVNWKSLQR